MTVKELDAVLLQCKLKIYKDGQFIRIYRYLEVIPHRFLNASVVWINPVYENGEVILKIEIKGD